MTKYFYTLLICLLFLSPSLQSQSDCEEINPRVETKAFLAEYAEKSNYDRVWYTKKTIQERILASFEPRETTEVGYYGDVHLELIIDQNGQVNEITFFKERHDVHREVRREQCGEWRMAAIQLWWGSPVAPCLI